MTDLPQSTVLETARMPSWETQQQNTPFSPYTAIIWEFVFFSVDLYASVQRTTETLNHSYDAICVDDRDKHWTFSASPRWAAQIIIGTNRLKLH